MDIINMLKCILQNLYCVEECWLHIIMQAYSNMSALKIKYELGGKGKKVI